MKYYSVLITEVTVNQREVIVYADNEIQAEVRATVGPPERVAKKEGVISVTPDGSSYVSKVYVREIPAEALEEPKG